MTGVQTCALPICFPVTIGGQSGYSGWSGISGYSGQSGFSVIYRDWEGMSGYSGFSGFHMVGIVVIYFASVNLNRSHYFRHKYFLKQLIILSQFVQVHL